RGSATIQPEAFESPSKLGRDTSVIRRSTHLDLPSRHQFLRPMPPKKHAPESRRRHRAVSGCCPTPHPRYGLPISRVPNQSPAEGPHPLNAPQCPRTGSETPRRGGSATQPARSYDRERLSLEAES